MSQQLIWADMDAELDALLAHWEENKVELLNFIGSSSGYLCQQPLNLDTQGGLLPLPLVTSALSNSLSPSPTQPQIPQPKPIPTQLNIKMRKVPFFETMFEFLRPTLLTSVINDIRIGHTQLPIVIEFSRLKAALVPKVPTAGKALEQWNSSRLHILLRFCLINSDSSSSVDTERSDCFPAGLQVKVNNWMVPFTNIGDEMVLDITRLVNISNSFMALISNIIQVNWKKEPGREYAISLHMVRKLLAREILQTIWDKPLSSSYTLSLIKEINSAASEEETCIPAELITVSLECPLVKRRMEYPCRSIAEGEGCKHVQCFDAYQFLLMNEINPKFKCPVCNKKLRFEDLRIDEFFLGILKKLPKDCENKVELYPDGRWKPVYSKSDSSVSNPKRRKIDYVSVDCSENNKVTINGDDKKDVVPILKRKAQPLQTSIQDPDASKTLPETRVGSENQCFLTVPIKLVGKSSCERKIVQGTETGSENDSELITLD